MMTDQLEKHKAPPPFLPRHHPLDHCRSSYASHAFINPPTMSYKNKAEEKMRQNLNVNYFTCPNRGMIYGKNASAKKHKLHRTFQQVNNIYGAFDFLVLRHLNFTEMFKVGRETLPDYCKACFQSKTSTHFCSGIGEI